jgi:hypothetical protein
VHTLFSHLRYMVENTDSPRAGGTFVRNV